MIFTWTFSLIFGIIGTVLDIFLNPVTALPFGIDTALGFVSGTMNSVSIAIPFLVVPWALAKWFLYIEVALFSFEIALWILTFGRHKPKSF